MIQEESTSYRSKDIRCIRFGLAPLGMSEIEENQNKNGRNKIASVNVHRYVLPSEKRVHTAPVSYSRHASWCICLRLTHGVGQTRSRTLKVRIHGVRTLCGTHTEWDIHGVGYARGGHME